MAFIVILSPDYAKSRWCLDELAKLCDLRASLGHPILPIFYEVDPSSVRKQKEDFGSAFFKTCQGKAEQVKQSFD